MKQNTPHAPAARITLVGLLLSVLVVMTLASSAIAAEQAGTAEQVSGLVRVERGDSSAFLRQGEPVHVGDRIRTGANATVRILFVDDSTISLSRNSHLEVTEYLFDPEQGRRSALSLWMGRARATVSRFAGDSDIRVNTPTAVAGVRGTDFVIEVAPAGDEYPDAGPEESPELYSTEVVVISGTVAVSSLLAELGEVLLSAGTGTSVGSGAPPTPPRQLAPAELQQIQQTAATTGGGSGGRGDYTPTAFNPADERQQFDGTTGGGDETTPTTTQPEVDADTIAETLSDQPSGNTPPPIQQEPVDRTGSTTPVVIEIRRQ